MNPSIKLIVGLGNPGQQYARTRHNAGIWWLETLANQHQVTLKPTSKFKAHLAQMPAPLSIRLCQPMTYMNESGLAVAPLAHFYKIPPEQILVVHDEIDLPPGQIKFKLSGGHGGHNGLRNIEKHLASRSFLRLRIGVGHPGTAAEVTNFVLNQPTIDERSHIDQAIQLSFSCLSAMFSGDWATVMQTLHSN